MGQQPLLHAGHHHHRKLQALGLVQGDQGQRVFRLLVLVNVGHQGHPLQECAETVHAAVAGRAVILGQSAQFQDVLPTLVAVVLGVDVLGQAGHIQHAVQQIRDGQLPRGVAQPVQRNRQVGDGTGGAGSNADGAGPALGASVGDVGHGRPGGDALSGGVCGQLLDGLRADAPGRRVDNPLQAYLVAGVVNHPQVAHRVLDFLAMVEPDAAHEPVRYPLPHALVFKGAALRVDAVHDGAVAGMVLAGPHQTGHLVHRPGRLILLAVCFVQRELRAHGIIGVQRAFDALLVGGDDAGRRIEDVLRGAVILAEADDRGVGKVALEAQDVADVGIAPRVDALVGVADRAEVPVRPGEQTRQPVLGDVGVLELVDQEVAIAVVVLRLHF